MLSQTLPWDVEQRRAKIKGECLPCSRCGQEIDYSLPTGDKMSFYPYVYSTTTPQGKTWTVEPRHYGCCI